MGCLEDRDIWPDVATRRNALSAPLDFLMTLPNAIPAMTVAVGLILIWNQAFWRPAPSSAGNPEPRPRLALSMLVPVVVLAFYTAARQGHRRWAWGLAVLSVVAAMPVIAAVETFLTNC